MRRMVTRTILESVWRPRILKESRAQDLVEYALLAGFVAVAAGVLIPDVSASMSKIYSRIASKLLDAGG